MKFGSLYTELTKNPETQEPGAQESVVGIQKSEARIQAQVNWKASTITQELVVDIKNEINDLIVKSISLAINYPQTANHEQIIQNLIKVDTLQKLLDKHIYGER